MSFRDFFSGSEGKDGKTWQHWLPTNPPSAVKGLSPESISLHSMSFSPRTVCEGGGGTGGNAWREMGNGCSEEMKNPQQIAVTSLTPRRHYIFAKLWFILLVFYRSFCGRQ